MSIFNWIKRHKILVVLALVIAYLLRNQVTPLNPIGFRSNSYMNVTDQTYSTGAAMPAEKVSRSGMGIPAPDYKPVSDSSERVVIQESNLSLLVKNVRETGDKIINTAKGMGGYMVEVSYNNPSESAYGTISIRVPTDKLDDALAQFRSAAVKVTNENLLGTDVTQEYQDLDQRIATLKETKIKFDEILKKAVTVDEILRVNQEIINLESQIDSSTGQKKAIADNARLTKVTLYLSTDELALPYTPDKTFRPDVIFKLAVRQLFTTLQSGAEFIIWLGVFAVIWIPILLIIILIKRSRQTPKSRLN